LQTTSVIVSWTHKAAAGATIVGPLVIDPTVNDCSPESTIVGTEPATNALKASRVTVQVITPSRATPAGEPDLVKYESGPTTQVRTVCETSFEASGESDLSGDPVVEPPGAASAPIVAEFG
jgi:hypothetical protein